MGWLITLGILLGLAVLPLGVDVRYDEEGAAVKAVLGPARLLLYPRPKKTPKKKSAEAPKKAAPPSEEENLPKPPQPPAPQQAPKAKGEKKGGSVLDFLPLVKTALDFLGDFRRKLRLDELELKLTLGGGDPCDLAMNYGRAWTALGNLIPQLERLFLIKKRDVEVQCDFTASQTLVFAHLHLTITLGRLLSLLVGYGVRALKEYLTIQNKRKGGAAI